MGIISRFTDIMSSNINSLLAKAESNNADKLLEKYLMDAKTNLGQIKAETAAVIAEEMALARKLNENEALQKKYAGYAAAAVKSQNDDDAMKFISYQAELETKAEDLSMQYEQAKQNSEKMRQMTRKLLADIGSVESKLNEAKQKLNIAKKQEQLNTLNEKMSQNPLSNVDSLFDEVQKRVDKAEAAASLQNAIDGNTNEIEDLAKKYEMNDGNKKASIEERLAQIKANL